MAQDAACVKGHNKFGNGQFMGGGTYGIRMSVTAQFVGAMFREEESNARGVQCLCTETWNVALQVLYFKVDEADQVWLQWSNCLRLHDKQSHNNVRLNLAQLFRCKPAYSAAHVRLCDLNCTSIVSDTTYYEHELPGSLAWTP